MKNLGIAALLLTAAAGGCGPYQVTDSQELTDGGPTGRNIETWWANDKQHRTDLKPTVSGWWQKEQTRWPKFRRTEPTAEDFYLEHRAAELEAQKQKQKDAELAAK
ncbi:hypothetical protein FACS1894108_05460 [Planctomycetales bacterium]|nr:hypothetical protein FACS1894108_05460 [Planctomycetales bacterium]GHV22360.1 hypothetical protein AGMMS49959_13030 [Planctomycetales bacterium]